MIVYEVRRREEQLFYDYLDRVPGHVETLLSETVCCRVPIMRIFIHQHPLAGRMF